MLIFLDTNVVLDVALQRLGNTEAEAVLLRCSEPQNEGYISWHGLATTHFILARYRNRVTATEFLHTLVAQVEVGPASTQLALRALQLGFRDTEDAMQAAVAEAVGADVIVTRNVVDFIRSPVVPMTPETFLSMYP